VAANEVFPSVFNRHTPAFESFCKHNQLEVVALAEDRHGSLVWETALFDGVLDRYVTLAITPNGSDAGIGAQVAEGAPLPNAGELFAAYALTIDEELLGPGYLAEIWIGAESDTRFVRRRLYYWRYRTDVEVQMALSVDLLSPSLGAAWQKAKALGLADLADEYPFPRPPLASLHRTA